MNPFWPIDYLLPLWLLVAAIGVLAAWRSTEAAAPRLRIGLVALRTLALLLLGVLLLNPGAWDWPVEEQDSEWLGLIDRSASMDVEDGAGPTRWAGAVNALQAAWQAEPQPERVRLHPFSGSLEPRLHSVDAFTDVQPDGATTHILAALDEALEVYERSRTPLDGILLISDGHELGPAPAVDPALRARSLGAPILAVALGGDVERRDLSLAPVRRHAVGFVGQPLRLQARVMNANLGDIRPEIHLLGHEGERLQTKPVRLASNEETIVTFEVSVEEPGYQEYRIETPAWPGEVTVANNHVRLAASILEQPARVLFVEGAPHWDSKFLLQLLRAQPYVRVTTVHRITGDRFFLTETDEHLSEVEERSVFPATQAELNQYDVVIFGKGAEYFLDAQRLVLLQRYVATYGGPVLFARGKPYAGSFPELEPLEPLQWGGGARGPFRLRPTVAADGGGLLGPWLPSRLDSVWDDFPQVQHAHRVARLQPFTQVWIESVEDGASDASVPVLAVRRLGRGRTAVVNAGELWRWDFFPDQPHASELYQQFWTALVQWMGLQADYLPGQTYALALSQLTADPGQAVQATIRRRSVAEGTDAVAPPIRIVRGTETVRTLSPQAVPNEEAEWRAIFTMNEPGIYRVELGEEAQGARATLEVRSPPDELMDVSADPAFLEDLARRSGGELIDLSDVADVPARFRRAVAVEQTVEPEWHTHWDRWWWAGLLVGCLGAEWFLRRRNGLM